MLKTKFPTLTPQDPKCQILSHIWAWQPSWSCDLDYLYTHWFPLPIDASYKIWL